jgi:hypothetical protein
VTRPRSSAGRTLAALGALALAALAVVTRAGRARGDDPAWSPSTTVFPPQRLPLTFSHATHLGRGGVTCVDCHARAATSRSALDRLTPDEDACRRCHPIDRAQPARDDRPTTACASCHPGWRPGDGTGAGSVERVDIPPPAIKFSHAAHAGARCEHCHAGVADVDLATRAQLPRMETCLECHDDVRARASCTTCHLAGHDGLVRTTLPTGALVPTGGASGVAHGPGFAEEHAQASRGLGAACASCHAPTFCVDCHLGSARPLSFHAGDYVSTHAIEARRNQPDCSTCHRTQSFCAGCHERAGVGTRAASGFRTAGEVGRFHPAGWASADGRGANHHAREAQRNLRQCTSCHREDDCLACHTAEPGGLRVSPHGPGWRGSDGCRALAARNGRLCLRCHIELRPVSCE